MEKSSTFKVVNLVSTVCILIIIWELGKLYPKFMQSAKSMEFDTYDLYRYFYVIGTVVIGILMEANRILKSIKIGFRVEWISFVLSLFLIGTLLLSHDQGASITGFGALYNIMQFGMFRSILGVVGGIHIARAFTGNINL